MARIAVITGGTGFIGQKLGVMLVRQGWSVRVISRNPRRTEGKLAFPAQLFAWRDADYAVPEEALEGAEAVFHLAGENIAEGRWTGARKDAIMRSRELSTRHLVEAILKMAEPPRVFVQSSAVGYYGDRNNEDLPETSSPGTDFLAEVCQRWEESGSTLAKTPVRWVALRTGVVFGLEGGAFPRLNTLYTTGLGANLGGGKQWMSWIHIDDLIRIMLYCLEDDTIQGPINAVAPNPVRFSNLHAAMIKETKAPFSWNAPAWPLKIALGEASGFLLASQRAIPARLEETTFTFQWGGCEEALHALFAQLAEKDLPFVAHSQWVPAEADDTRRFLTELKARETVKPQKIPVTWHTTTEALGSGTLISNIVFYNLPTGIFGKLGAGAFANRDLAEIFTARTEALTAHFFPPHH